MSFKDTLLHSFNAVKNTTIKHSPQILMGVGVVSTVGAIVVTVKKSRDINDILEEHKRLKEEFTQLKEESDDVAKLKDEPSEYTDDVYKSDIRAVHCHTAIKLAKAFAPTAVLTAVGIGSFILANSILSKRYKLLYGAYTSVVGTFAAYRARVKQEYGEDADYRCMYGFDKKKKVEVTTYDENGNEVKTKEELYIDRDNSYGVSEYARYFSPLTTVQCTTYDHYNRNYIDNCVQYAKDLIYLKGRCTLNDVYDMLGFEKTYKGQAVGWTDADNVSIAVIPLAKETNDNVFEKTLLLDFENLDFILDDFKDIKFVEQSSNRPANK